MDTYAWIEYFRATPRGLKVRDIVEDPRQTAFTSCITTAEVVSKFLREGKDPDPATRAIEENSTVTPVTQELAKMAGEVHAEMRKREPSFGLADAFVLATARTRSIKVLTGDPHFKHLPETMMI